jgi:hypothetical protein
MEVFFLLMQDKLSIYSFLCLFSLSSSFYKHVTMTLANLTLHDTVKQRLAQLGIRSFESNFDGLELGQPVLLEGKTLGEIGTALILLEAEVLSSKMLSGHQRTFEALSSIGVPIYCWNEARQRNCLLLKLIDSKIAIKLDTSDVQISQQFKEEG